VSGAAGLVSDVSRFFEEAWIVSKRSVLTFALVLIAGAFAPAYAQTEAAAGAANATEVARWSILTAGFALAIAAGLGALGQGKAVASAAEAIARNPGATGDIRGALLLGLVLIESLVIYVLLISLLLFFFNPFR
jgi:F-type H+-transporting ATPase subunit c